MCACAHVRECMCMHTCICMCAHLHACPCVWFVDSSSPQGLYSCLTQGYVCMCACGHICGYKWTQMPHTCSVSGMSSEHPLLVSRGYMWCKQVCWDLKSGMNGMGWVRYKDSHVTVFVLEGPLRLSSELPLLQAVC